MFVSEWERKNKFIDVKRMGEKEQVHGKGNKRMGEKSVIKYIMFIYKELK